MSLGAAAAPSAVYDFERRLLGCCYTSEEMELSFTVFQYFPRHNIIPVIFAILSASLFVLGTELPLPSEAATFAFIMTVGAISGVSAVVSFAVFRGKNVRDRKKLQFAHEVCHVLLGVLMACACTLWYPMGVLCATSGLYPNERLSTCLNSLPGIPAATMSTLALLTYCRALVVIPLIWLQLVLTYLTRLRYHVHGELVDNSGTVAIHCSAMVVFGFLCSAVAVLADRSSRRRFEISFLASKAAESVVRLRYTLDRSVEPLLPSSVWERLSSGHRVFDAAPMATVIVCDLLDFAQWCTTTLPADVVDTIGFLYSAMDRHAHHSSFVEKAKAVGDRYIATSGLLNWSKLTQLCKSVSRNDTEDGTGEALLCAYEQAAATVGAHYAVLFALEQLNIVADLNHRASHVLQPLHASAIVHSGSLFGTTFGEYAISYEVVGEGIEYVLSTLFHCGAPDRVVISSATAALLPRLGFTDTSLWDSLPQDIVTHVFELEENKLTVEAPDSISSSPRSNLSESVNRGSDNGKSTFLLRRAVTRLCVAPLRGSFVQRFDTPESAAESPIEGANAPTTELPYTLNSVPVQSIGHESFFHASLLSPESAEVSLSQQQHAVPADLSIAGQSQSLMRVNADDNALRYRIVSQIIAKRRPPVSSHDRAGILEPQPMEALSIRCDGFISRDIVYSSIRASLGISSVSIDVPRTTQAQKLSTKAVPSVSDEPIFLRFGRDALAAFSLLLRRASSDQGRCTDSAFFGSTVRIRSFSDATAETEFQHFFVGSHRFWNASGLALFSIFFSVALILAAVDTTSVDHYIHLERSSRLLSSTRVSVGDLFTNPFWYVSWGIVAIAVLRFYFVDKGFVAQESHAHDFQRLLTSLNSTTAADRVEGESEKQARVATCNRAVAPLVSLFLCVSITLVMAALPIDVVNVDAEAFFFVHVLITHLTTLWRPVQLCSVLMLGLSMCLASVITNGELIYESSFILSAVVGLLIGFAASHSRESFQREHFAALCYSRALRKTSEEELELQRALFGMLLPAHLLDVAMLQIQSTTPQAPYAQFYGDLCTLEVHISNAPFVLASDPLSALLCTENTLRKIDDRIASLRLSKSSILQRIGFSGDSVLIAGPLEVADTPVIPPALAPNPLRTATASIGDEKTSAALEGLTAPSVCDLKLSLTGILEFIAMSLLPSEGRGAQSPPLAVVPRLTMVACYGSAFGALIGSKSLTFQIVGFVSRQSSALIRAAPQGFCGVTEAFQRAVANHDIAMPTLTDANGSTETIAYGPSHRWRVRGAGAVTLVILQQQHVCE